MIAQAVDHPYLVVHSASGAAAAAAAKEKAAAEEEDLTGGLCGVCHDPLEQPVVAGCGHAFCRVCLAEYLDGCAAAAACPSCQRPLSVDLAAAAPVRLLFFSSSKNCRAVDFARNGEGSGCWRRKNVVVLPAIIAERYLDLPGCKHPSWS